MDVQGYSPRRHDFPKSCRAQVLLRRKSFIGERPRRVCKTALSAQRSPQPKPSSPQRRSRVTLAFSVSGRANDRSEA